MSNRRKGVNNNRDVEGGVDLKRMRKLQVDC